MALREQALRSEWLRFGELIRYGSVYLEQTRDEIAYVDPVEPEPEQIMHKGIYEP